MTLIRSEIIGFGHYLPNKVLTNDDLSQMVETSDEWISTRTGIKSRHVVEGELTSDMALKAASNALKVAEISGEEVELVVVATVTPDNTTPAMAGKISAALGTKPGTPAFDMSAACSVCDRLKLPSLSVRKAFPKLRIGQTAILAFYLGMVPVRSF